MTDATNHAFATRAIHAGEEPDLATGAHNTPIYQTATYAFQSLEEKDAILGGEREGYIYSRYGNPTSHAFESKLAILEGAELGLVAASGMGVISAALLGIAGNGDHIVASDAVYSVADEFLENDLPRYGIEVTRVDVSDLDAVRAAIRDNTRILYTEFLSNPRLKVADIPALAAIARERDIVSIVDNTFATPYLLRPIEHGVDLVLHSATKYISGHGDVIAGAICGCEKYISCTRHMVTHLGSPNSPFNSWLLLRGIKTLELRMERHCQNALEVARFLDTHEGVLRVHYPGLESHPGHDVARHLTGGRYGGMLSFEIEGGDEMNRRFADALQLCDHAVSLGDVSTLVWPDSKQTLIRVSVGIEAADDIIADFNQALFKIG
jgi:methionine-gamma-lyase